VRSVSSDMSKPDIDVVVWACPSSTIVTTPEAALKSVLSNVEHPLVAPSSSASAQESVSSVKTMGAVTARSVSSEMSRPEIEVVV